MIPTLLAQQFLPALVAFAVAWLWLLTRAPSRWWGALAGFAALAVPSPVAAVSLLIATRSTGHPEVALTSLPASALWFVLAALVLVACLGQRAEPLRQQFALAVTLGFAAREVVALLVLLVLTGLAFTHL